MARIENKEFYIDVICAGPRSDYYNSHNGSMLIDMAKKFAEQRKLHQVTLSALPQVLTYYPRFAFAHRTSCSQPPDIELPEKLKKRIKEGTIPKKLDDAYNDDDMLDYMAELQVRNYSNRNKYKCSTAGKTKERIKQSIKNARCGDDGFKMRYCLKEFEESVNRRSSRKNN